MLKISYTGCLGLSSSAISSQFTVEMCAAVKNCRKFIKNPSFGGSRSFKVIDVDRSTNPVTSAFMISSMSVPIYNCFHGRRANNSKITSY